jgi:hypothetical protein
MVITSGMVARGNVWFSALQTAPVVRGGLSAWSDNRSRKRCSAGMVPEKVISNWTSF